jgi:hypothetical protein
MKNRIILLSILVFLVYINLNAQLSFLGFDPPQCGILSSHDYSYDNSVSCSHGSGYKLFNNGIKIYEKCCTYGGCAVADIFFINNSVGFLIELNAVYSTGVYKTTNSGLNWNRIGTGNLEYLAYYVINQNTGFLITHFENAVSVMRITDLYYDPFYHGFHLYKDTVVTDTIFGDPLCDQDYLRFSIKSGNDTFDCHIKLIITPINTNEFKNEDKIEITPNPVQDYIHLNFVDSKLSKSAFNIYNCLGIKIKSFYINKPDKYEFYIGDLKKGNYIIEIYNAQKRIIGKIIKY